MKKQSFVFDKYAPLVYLSLTTGYLDCNFGKKNLLIFQKKSINCYAINRCKGHFSSILKTTFYLATEDTKLCV